MSLLPSKEKYIMFLESKYFKKHLFKTIYNKIIKRLKNKGIVVFEIEPAIEKLKLLHKSMKSTCNLTFDDNPFPSTNTLYIHLFNNQYFNEKLFNKKKIEIEREMLFLLAGKLGVKEINYETEVIETTISKLNSNIKMKGINGGITFNKNINKTNGTKGREEYLNRGAPVYLKSNNLQEVEKNIEDRMGLMKSNVFNYNFYKNSTKLESFVYKRYEFKMQKLEYYIETDDLTDITFAVNSCFIDYGIDLSFEKSVSYNENIHYILEFFTDTELYKEFGKLKRNYTDEFYSIRELYELMDDKDKAVHLISEYVVKYANTYKYKLIDSNIIYNFSKNIDEFIKNNEYGYFEGICHNFHSTSQIKNWINKTFLTDKMITLENEYKYIYESTDEIPKVTQTEKEELDKLKDIDNIRVNDLINNCNDKKKIPISVHDWDFDDTDTDICKSKSEPILNKSFGLNDTMFAHMLCTMVRPPVLPSSCCTSLHSEDSPTFPLPPIPQNNQVDNNRETDI
jgi:hypothetical protein